MSSSNALYMRLHFSAVTLSLLSKLSKVLESFPLFSVCCLLGCVCMDLCMRLVWVGGGGERGSFSEAGSNRVGFHVAQVIKIKHL